jgi:hypothetical protein
MLVMLLKLILYLALVVSSTYIHVMQNSNPRGRLITSVLLYIVQKLCLPA